MSVCTYSEYDTDQAVCVTHKMSQFPIYCMQLCMFRVHVAHTHLKEKVTYVDMPDVICAQPSLECFKCALLSQ